MSFNKEVGLFDVTIGLNNIASVESFPEAFKLFFTEAKKMAQESASMMVVEQTSFIVFNGEVAGKTVRLLMNIKQVGEFAYEKGLLKFDENQQKEFLADPMPEVDDEEVIQAFCRATDENVQFELDRLGRLAEITVAFAKGTNSL